MPENISDASTEPAPPPVVPPAPAPAASLTIGQRFSALADKVLSGGPPADPKELAAAKAEIAALNEKVAALTAERDAEKAKAENAMKGAAVALGQLAAMEDGMKDFEARVNTKAIRKSIEMCASAGVPAAELPQIGAQASGEDREATLRKRLAATDDPKEKGKICLELSSIRSWNN